ncbi:MAG: hypothetical protein QG653_225 [Patescibacteria group bacterium]|nr:hypothetical protein [Patescibacteria group bacterium]
MNNTTYIKFSVYATLAGVLFSGYLSATKLFSEICAFNESCAYFMGYPACYIGFAIFLMMFIVSVAGALGLVSAKNLSGSLSGLSSVGVLFSGYIVFQENFAFTTCTLGFLFYVLIFFVSARKLTS